MELTKRSVGLYGDFKLRVFDHSEKEPRLVFRWAKKNQITNEGRVALLTLMCPFGIPDGQSINRIWSFAVGTNAVPPTVDNTVSTMTSVFTSVLAFGGGECTIVAVPPNSYYLAISKTLTSADANGSTLVEAGIFTRGDNDVPASAAGRKLYARQVHTPIEKVASMTVQYDWQLGITIQS